MDLPLSTKVLHCGDFVHVTDVRCRAHDRGCGGEECSDADVIVFPRRGFFVRHVGKQSTLADANRVLFFRRHESYRVSHPVCGGDDCTSLTFSPELLREAFGAHDPFHPEAGGRDIERRPVWSNRDRFQLLQQFRRAVLEAGTDPGSAIQLDELALGLLSGIADDLARSGTRPRGEARASTLRAHRDLVEATRERLARNMRASFTLAEIARAVHSSPFHLSRVFQRLTGLPIHRYLVRLRLRESLEQLADGCDSLTELALDLGFSSHSHFSDSFRREFGCSPSERRNSPLLRFAK